MHTITPREIAIATPMIVAETVPTVIAETVAIVIAQTVASSPTTENGAAAIQTVATVMGNANR